MQSYLQEKSRLKAIYIRYLIASTLKYFNANFQYPLGFHVIHYFIAQTARISTSIGLPSQPSPLLDLQTSLLLCISTKVQLLGVTY